MTETESSTTADSNDELWLSVRCVLNQADGQRLTQALDDIPGILPGMAGYYELLYDESRPQQDTTAIIIYFDLAVAQPAIQLELLLAALQIEQFEIQQESVKRLDYMQAYKEYYQAQQISRRFHIVPSWLWSEWQAPDPDSMPLVLDPGLAFGTGQHPTTQLCLEFLDEHPPVDQSLIDAGCGSGILSLGALLCQARSVYAFDIDSNAILATRQNIAMNQDRITGSLLVEQGGFELARLDTIQCDLLLGNLTASILVQNLEGLNRIATQRILLSGIIQHQLEFVLQNLENIWTLQEHKERDGWQLLYLERKTIA
ncbi:MAG: 50S ribosomal protein L11 methyltransferase [Leptospiraceae bacterium]|nr:50S ribosomal protein L11 methyltransferase [Leptospiraceae bacterium]